jgi:type IV pilus assembly protein PilC
VTQTFTYKARDRGGQLVSGKLQGDTAALVAGKLRDQGYIPVSVKGGAAAGANKKELKIPGFGGKVKKKEVAVFARQFATMINAGISLLRSLSILSDQTENKELARILGEVRNDVEGGSSLSVALARHPKAFDRLFVSMVRSGETGGMLDSVLLRMATTMEKQVELKRKVKSAMTYPVVVGALIVLIVGGMILFIVPMFKGMYVELGGTLPLPTRVLLGISSAVTGKFYLVILFSGGGVYGWKRWLKTTAGRKRWDSIKLRLPVFGSLVHKTLLARFARTLGALVRSGVSILDALDLAADTAGNAVMAAALEDTKTAVSQGEPMSRPLESHPVFPGMVVQMLAVGEETGALDELLDKIADYYDSEVSSTVDALTSLIEPLLIVGMGLSVGGMVIALYLPMFNIVNLLK